MKFITTKKKIIGVIGIIIIAGGSYYWYSASKTKTAGVQYKTAVVEKGMLSVFVSGSGNIIVDDSANIDPTITGTVANLSVAVGDKVEKGQFLFSIENEDLSVNAKKAHVSYLQSLASLETAKANKKEAKETFEDADSDDDEYIAKKKLEAAEISVTVSEENIKSIFFLFASPATFLASLSPFFVKGTLVFSGQQDSNPFIFFKDSPCLRR